MNCCLYCEVKNSLKTWNIEIVGIKLFVVAANDLGRAIRNPASWNVSAQQNRVDPCIFPILFGHLQSHEDNGP